MFFRKKKSIYSDNLDVVKKCATCKFGTELSYADDVMCSKKHGIVKKDGCCKFYDYNRLISRPPRKRSVAGTELKKEDFSID